MTVEASHDGRDGRRERPSWRALAAVRNADRPQPIHDAVPLGEAVTVDRRLLGERVRPVTLAGELVLAVPGSLGELLGGGVPRGAVTIVEGPLGAGRSSLVLDVLAAATGAGEWAAVVTLGPSGPSGPGEPGGSGGAGGQSGRGGRGTFGVSAAISAGVALDRLAFVRRVPSDRWAAIVASLIDGCSVVVADAPPHVRVPEARRLLARLRERRVILLTDDRWPDRAARRVRVLSGHWSGLETGDGRLVERELRVEVLARDRRLATGALAPAAAAG